MRRRDFIAASAVGVASVLMPSAAPASPGPTVLDYADKAFPGLYPAQRFALKLAYGLELSDVPGTVDVHQPLSNEVVARMSEVEYLAYLQRRGDAGPIPSGREPIAVVANFGMRSGSTILGLVISGYELSRSAPADGRPNRVAFVDTDKNQVMCNVNAFLYAARDSGMSPVNVGAHSVQFADGSEVRFQTSLSKRGLEPVSVIKDLSSYSEKDVRKVSLWASQRTSSPGRNKVFFLGASGNPKGFPESVRFRIPTWDMNPALPEELMRRFPEEYSV
jgi:hypothetical protein